MRLSKKAAMLVSFAVGTTMFATAAMAEVTSKSGYEQLKDAVKYTSSSCDSKLSNYTTNISYVIKDTNTVIASEDSVIKSNVPKNIVETTTTTKSGNKSTTGYSYQDENTLINNDSSIDNVYHEVDYTSPNNFKPFSDPFKEKNAADFEKIADALVGNLKDYVVVSQNSDGSKELSTSLTETQIPSLFNAVIALEIKSDINTSYTQERYNYQMPKLTNNIFIKDAKEKMLINKDGLIQNLSVTGTLSGKDDKGEQHNLSLELLMKLTNINSTTVQKPDLTGKKVEKTTGSANSTINIKKLVGKYKNDIVIDKGDSYVKAGERTLEITSSDNTTISGTYHEEYKKGFENYAANKEDFSFTGKLSKNSNQIEFTYTNSAGKTCTNTMIIDSSLGKIYFNTVNGNYDGQFNRVFD